MAAYPNSQAALASTLLFHAITLPLRGGDPAGQGNTRIARNSACQPLQCKAVQQLQPLRASSPEGAPSISGPTCRHRLAHPTARSQAVGSGHNYTAAVRRGPAMLDGHLHLAVCDAAGGHSLRVKVKISKGPRHGVPVQVGSFPVTQPIHLQFAASVVSSESRRSSCTHVSSLEDVPAGEVRFSFTWSLMVCSRAGWGRCSTLGRTCALLHQLVLAARHCSAAQLASGSDKCPAAAKPSRGRQNNTLPHSNRTCRMTASRFVISPISGSGQRAFPRMAASKGAA